MGIFSKIKSFFTGSETTTKPRTTVSEDLASSGYASASKLETQSGGVGGQVQTGSVSSFTSGGGSSGGGGSDIQSSISDTSLQSIPIQDISPTILGGGLTDIQKYQASRSDFYSNQINQELSREGNINQLPAYQQNKIYNKIYDKYNKMYQEDVETISKELSKEEAKKRASYKFTPKFDTTIKEGEFVSKDLGGVYKAPKGTGGKGTATFVRSFTPDESIQLERFDTTGDFIKDLGWELPMNVMSLGTRSLSKPSTPEEQTTIYDPDSYLQTLINIVDPRKHLEVIQSQKEYEKAIPEFLKINEKLEQANKDYEAGKIDYDQLTATFNYYQSLPEYKKVATESQTRKTIFQSIKESDLSPLQQDLATFGVTAVEVGAYINPIYRTAVGVESLAHGTEALGQAKTTREQLQALTEIGLGTILVKSGFRGGASVLGKKGGQGILGRLSKFEKDMGFTIAGESGGVATKTLQLLESRAGQFAKKTGIPAVFGTQTGLDVYGQTGDISMSVAGGLGTFVGIKAPITFEAIRGGTKLTRLEQQRLKKDLDALEGSEIKDFSVVNKGKGKLPNSDRVDVLMRQKHGKFVRNVKVSGDLIKGKSGKYTLFPEGKGEAITMGTIKEKGQSEKGFLNKQNFDLKQVSQGIQLGEIDNYRIGTTESLSFYNPRLSASKIFKVPKGRGIVRIYKIAKVKIKDFLAKTEVQEGGRRTLEYEKGKTGYVERKEGTPEERPYSTEPLKFEITETSEKLGKYLRENNLNLDAVGVIKGEKRTGSYIKVSEIPIKDMIIKKAKGIKKTPLSKTFQEPEIKQDLLPPREQRPIQQQVQVKVDTTKRITEPPIEEFSRKIVETTQKGLRKGTKKAVERIKLDTRISEIPKSVWGIEAGQYSKELEKQINKGKQKELQKTQQRERLKDKIIDIDKTLQRNFNIEIQKERLGTKQVTRQIQELIQTEMATPRPTPPIPINPPSITPRIPIFGFRRRKPQEQKKQSKEQGFDVYVKEPKTKRYVKVTKKPIGLKEARDVRAYLIDETTSRTGRIEPRKARASPLQLEVPRGYAEDTSRKFRSFRQRKGKRTKLVKTIIEKNPYLLDTRGEKKQINIFKKLAQIEKRKQRNKQRGIVGLDFA